MTYSKVLDEAFLYASEVPIALLEREIERALYDFLRRSRVYCPDYGVIKMDVVSGQTTYDFSGAAAPEALLDFARINGVKYNGEVLTFPYWEHVQPKTVELDFEPRENITDGITIKVSLTTRDATLALTVPDWIYDKWAEHIAAYAISRLMLIPDRPWTDYEQSALFRRRFNEGLTDALNYFNQKIKMRPLRDA